MIKIKSVITCLVIGIIMSSCVSDNRTQLPEMCLCEVTEHYITTTNEIENRMKEFSFTDSQLFGFGVSKDDFAKSIALFINENWDLDSLAIIKINLIRAPEGKNTITTYEYSKKTLRKES